jgi:glycosyltransferase involved in cell wall biosynthesis
MRLHNPWLKIIVIPNGVDLSYFRVLPAPQERSHLVFTGSMDWRPNQDALRYFIRDVLPLIRHAQPDVECTFVGRRPPKDIQRLGEIARVTVTGTVDDVRPYVERAAVCVVPLRIGGGSRLKILEAFAMGRPVVSTRIGAEGLDVVQGKHLLLADDPRQFAESVIDLLKNEQQSRLLGHESRKLVERQYGWDSLATRFGDFIRETLGEWSPSSR